MLVGLIAVVNPYSAIPIFLTLTYGAEKSERAQLIKIVALSVS